MKQGIKEQLRTVFLVEILLVSLYALFLYIFWTNYCAGSLKQCLGGSETIAPLKFLFLSFLRPVLLTPQAFMTYVAGSNFSLVTAALLSALGNVLSCLSIFLISKHIGVRLVRPWLITNLPETYKFLRSQDYKVVFLMRCIPFIPFDFLSIAFGAANFRISSVLLATFLGSLPESIILSKLASPNAENIMQTTLIIGVVVVVGSLIILGFEIISRRKGYGLIRRMRAMFRELEYEIRRNNDIIKRFQHDDKKIPILLLYGFFSSRRALTVLEKHLIARGYNVLSFNLGGLLGVFFTRGITETASFIDYKLKRQFTRYNFDKIHIVAHSKGGLVALWWLLKLGGSKHCSKVICLGTPFRGSSLTYLALITPLGYMWRDVWQMRPGSSFIKQLRDAPIPKESKIFCLYSDRDRVSNGNRGKYFPRYGEVNNVTNILMKNVGHFEFLYKRMIANEIATILGSPYKNPTALDEVTTREVEISSENLVSLHLPLTSDIVSINPEGVSQSDGEQSQITDDSLADTKPLSNKKAF